MSRIYHQFCGKQELGFEVLNRQFERCAERGLAILRGRMTDPIERSSLLVDALVAAHAELGCSFRSPFCELAAEIADAHKGLRIRIAQVFVR